MLVDIRLSVSQYDNGGTLSARQPAVTTLLCISSMLTALVSWPFEVPCLVLSSWGRHFFAPLSRSVLASSGRLQRAVWCNAVSP